MSTIRLAAPIPRHPEWRFARPIHLNLGEGQNAVIIGPNGGGKSLLAKYLAGGVSLDSGSITLMRSDGSLINRQDVYTMSFRDIYRLGGDSTNDYYQKRWHSTENDESPIVHQILGADVIRTNRDLLRAIGVDPILRKRLINLSSGEQRKLMIVRCLLREPQILIIDNPYIGLDPESRQTVNTLLSDIATNCGTKVILLISHPKDLPEWIDTVIAVKNKDIVCQTTRVELLANHQLLCTLFDEYDLPTASIGDLPRAKDDTDYENAVILRSVSITYGNAKILHNLDWKIRRGEKWALLGKNGAGKSTLLSLVCADNPQAYANDITLFDRQRGTGESIWEIKKHIGYVSPDMHAYYRADISCEDVVASGFFDAVGLYNKPSESQRILARRWMQTFHCLHLANRPFLQTSYGEQRLVLLVRVFVKSPSLVILDEPLHGLDAGKKHLAKLLIENYCSNPDVTLVYVTHYHDEIPSVVAHRMNLIKNS